MDNWTELIDDLVAGRWINPETQDFASVPFESIVIRENMEGQEVELLKMLIQIQLRERQQKNLYKQLF